MKKQIQRWARKQLGVCACNCRARNATYTVTSTTPSFSVQSYSQHAKINKVD